VSFTIDGLYAGETGAQLDDRYGIMVRAGLHCAPLAHEGLGTAPDGTVRASFGPHNDEDDVERLAEAVRELADEVRPCT
jgi:cysteine desulfurase / selenocysteine lyase